MPKPSVGRIVLTAIDPAMNNGAKVAPAIITRVWSDTTVNLRVIADSENLLWRTSVTYTPDLDALASGDLNPLHHWTWPPRA